MMNQGDMRRFWGKVQKSEFCWRWSGATSTNGYGRYLLSGKVRQAHRVAYEMEHGPIPKGYEIDHLCRVKRCVRPKHLEAVSHRENCLRGIGPTALNAMATSCVRGHPLVGPNVRQTRRGRRCKACHRLQGRKSGPYLRRPLFGEANPAAKLSAEKVCEIRIIGRSLSQTEVASRFGISRANVSLILARKSWTQV